jgi:hypothetical protein
VEPPLVSSITPGGTATAKANHPARAPQNNHARPASSGSHAACDQREGSIDALLFE